MVWHGMAGVDNGGWPQVHTRNTHTRPTLLHFTSSESEVKAVCLSNARFAERSLW